MIIIYYRLNQFDYNLIDETTSGKLTSTFEDRVAQIVDSLIINLPSATNKTSNDYSSTQLLLNNEHEGKTLIHLCAAAGFKNLFERFTRLRQMATADLDLRLVKNELNVFKLDHHGDTPMVI